MPKTSKKLHMIRNLTPLGILPGVAAISFVVGNIVPSPFRDACGMICFLSLAAAVPGLLGVVWAALSKNGIAEGGNNQQDHMEKPAFNVRVIAEEKFHDLMHEHPVYPNLKGIVLRDLQVNSEETEQMILFYSEEEQRDLAKEFFSGGSLLSDRGTVLTESEKDDAFGRMLDFGRKLQNSSIRLGEENGSTTCEAGYFYCRYYMREVPCWDGGNCGTDIESRSISFKLFNEEPDCWEQLLEESKKRYPNERRKNILVKWKRSWGYCGRLIDDTTEIVVGEYGYLFLRNPFGLRGIFRFSWH